MEEHRKLGGDTSVDVSYQYLGFFLEDDARLAEIKQVRIEEEEEEEVFVLVLWRAPRCKYMLH